MSAYLHPLFVHLPLAIAMCMPFLTLAAILFYRKESQTQNNMSGANQVWTMLAIPLVLAALFTVFAVIAGEAGVDAIKEQMSVAGQEALEAHEELAELFAMFLYVTAGLSLFIFIFQGRQRLKFLYAILALSLLLSSMGFYVGKSGGVVVYREEAPVYLNRFYRAPEKGQTELPQGEIRKAER